MKTVYGPVPSWRFGKSLGIDPVCRREKICSFNCEYCQLGETKVLTTKRKIFVEAETVEADLKNALAKTKPDMITISGTAEPTLALNMGEIVKIIKKNSTLPSGILTNSSFLDKKEVRDALGNLNIVVAKLDAPNEEIFKKINGPAEGITFSGVLEGIKKMKSEFKGELHLQMMFTNTNKDYAEEMAEISREINPDEVQLNTPLRPSKVKPLSKDEMEQVKKHFEGLDSVCVYDAEKTTSKPLDLNEMHLRRPEK
ncbi:radical SAM protein [Candidatus Micrarchaeota archaeon]|nr:radical SAM protein [Candidatus Micrarchaeota archaeon]